MSDKSLRIQPCSGSLSATTLKVSILDCVFFIDASVVHSVPGTV